MNFLRRPHRYPLQTALTAVLALGLLTVGTPGARAADHGDLEQRIKAAYLYNFTKFIQWPAAAQEDPASPFVLAIVGPDRFGDALAPLRRKRVQGRPLQVIQLDAGPSLPKVDMLFVAHQSPKLIKRVLTGLAAKPTLTIGDAPTFIQHGGLINFYMADKKIRFEINAQAADRKGFKISSQLLKLARIVEGETP
jgi:hypothetical protein